MAVEEIVTDFFDRRIGLSRSGNLVIKGGVVQVDAAGENVSLTAATVTVTQAAHAERDALMLNRAAGITVTLPAALGTGAKYRFVVGTKLTSNNYKIQVASATDYMRGKAWLLAATNAAFPTANTDTSTTESDTITLNGGTTGGLLGDVVELTDMGAGQWQVEASLSGSGTAATPFSVAV